MTNSNILKCSQREDVLSTSWFYINWTY